jgi:hypothetical protein
MARSATRYRVLGISLVLRPDIGPVTILAADGRRRQIEALA